MHNLVLDRNWLTVVGENSVKAPSTLYISDETVAFRVQALSKPHFMQTMSSRLGVCANERQCGGVMRDNATSGLPWFDRGREKSIEKMFFASNFASD